MCKEGPGFGSPEENAAVGEVVEGRSPEMVAGAEEAAALESQMT